MEVQKRYHALQVVFYPVVDFPDQGGAQVGIPRQALVFSEPAFGNIAHDAGERAPAVQHGFTDIEFHRELLAVFTQARHFAADADDFLLAGGEVAGNVAIMLFAIGSGHQHVHVPADGLGRGIAENPFGGVVERLDQGVLVDDDDGVDCRFHHQPGKGFLLAQRSDHALAFGDIARYAGNPGDVAFVVQDRHFDSIKPAPFSADQLAAFYLQGLLHAHDLVVFRGAYPRVVLMEDFVIGFPDRINPTVAVMCEESLVYGDIASRGILQPGDIGNAVEQRSLPLLG